MEIFVILFAVAVATGWALAYKRANGLAWSIWLAALVVALDRYTGAPEWLVFSLWGLTAIFAALSIVKPLRRAVVTAPIFRIYKKIMPQVSQTEQEALDAGSIWWDADLFTGRPDWKKLLAYPHARLSAEEQAFVDGPVEELCGMLDEWDATHERMDLQPEVWKYIREHNVPYNALHDRGYPSIGCAPCTRAVQPGEHERAGRWWWEHPETKECGLHVSRPDER